MDSTGCRSVTPLLQKYCIKGVTVTLPHPVVILVNYNGTSSNINVKTEKNSSLCARIVCLCVSSFLRIKYRFSFNTCPLAL